MTMSCNTTFSHRNSTQYGEVAGDAFLVDSAVSRKAKCKRKSLSVAWINYQKACPSWVVTTRADGY